MRTSIRRHRSAFNFREGNDFAGVGPNARGGDGVNEKVRVCGTDLRLRRRELEVMFLQLFEQSRNGEDVSGGIRVEPITSSR